MSAEILDGLGLSRLVRARIAERSASLHARGIIPRLDVLMAAQDPSSVKYVEMKRKWAEKAGIAGEVYPITDQTTQVHGILIQHPLPNHLDEQAALLELGSEKDVDGIAPESLGRLVSDMPGFRCATPLGAIRLLEHYAIELSGKRAVVVGRSVILGKPMALMLLQKNATVTIAHSRTQNLPDLCREADILVAAVGKPEMIQKDWVKPGAVVVDAGYNRVEGRTSDVGDVDFEGGKEVAGWITPVPGGIGPMTVATLLSNCVDAAEAAAHVR
jgi:methylenetetrahydrofolate dehydrogenase (NADP+)/methenyltetrahydrofolate cyclohydrolase